MAVISHPASVDSRLNHIADLFWEHPEIRLTAIMGPQHGARGETQDDMIEWQDYRDRRTGLPVFSLYGEVRKPTAEMLSHADVVVFDLQDVGARYYTFIHTLALTMEACAEAGKELLVLDRPNPIGGRSVEGPVLDPDFRSFVGLHPLAIRHGMTVAEIALYLNGEFDLGCSLEVVPVEGWERSLYFDETGLPWVLPSPNIPTFETCLVYPGMCLFEGTNVSEGRGTTRPFELSGAPWIEGAELADALRDLGLAGARFRPASFIPTFHKWAGQMVSGVQIHVTNRDEYRPFRTGLAMLLLYRKLGPDRFQWKAPPYEYEYEKLPFDIISGTDSIRNQIETGSDLAQIEASWQDDLARFREVREKYLIY